MNPLRSQILLPIVLFVGWSALIARAQEYDWLRWSFPSNQAAAAHVPERGDITVSTGGQGRTSIRDMRLHFDTMRFGTRDAAAVGAEQLSQGSWTTTIDLSTTSRNGELVIGLGNLAVAGKAYPGYRLAVFDRAGTAIPLSSLLQIGSIPHTWTAGYPDQSFNDPVMLNVTNGQFELAFDGNSDVLLLLIPPEAGKLVVSSMGPTSCDTINIVAGLPRWEKSSDFRIARSRTDKASLGHADAPSLRTNAPSLSDASSGERAIQESGMP